MIEFRNYIKNNRGQTIVELALALPVLLLIIAGTMEFGRVLHELLVVTASAREGARAAAVGSSDANVIAIVKAAAVSIDKGNLQVNIMPNTRTRGNSVTVIVSNQVQLFTPLISRLFPQNPYPVEGKSIMRVE